MKRFSTALAKTGKGHGIGQSSARDLRAPRARHKIRHDDDRHPHPNTLDFTAFDKDGNVIGKRRVCSVGGGAIEIEGRKRCRATRSLPIQEFRGDKEYCKKENIRIPDLVERFEGKGIWHYLDRVWIVMNSCIKRGLAAEGESCPAGSA